MIEHDWRYRLAHYPDKVYLNISKLQKYILVRFNLLIHFWQLIFSVWDNTRTWEVSRKLTKPLHHIWIHYYIKIKKRNDAEYDLIDTTEGLQIIGGNTGEGKSTLAFDVAEKSRILKNKLWYINTLIEKPRYYEPVKSWVRFHRYLPFEKVWSNFKMHMRLNNEVYDGYILDEIHRILDYRQNQTTEYASKFVPFRDYAVLVRKHIKKIIGITQMDRLDIQLMYLVKMWHKPRIDIGFDYEDWMLKTGLFRFKIKGWFIDSYTINTANSNDMLVHYKSWYRKAIADFEYFDTYAFSDAYNHLPYDNPRVNYA